MNYDLTVKSTSRAGDKRPEKQDISKRKQPDGCDFASVLEKEVSKYNRTDNGFEP